MCGIAVIFTPGRPLDLGLLEAMTRVQAHRGPDGEGYVLLPLSGQEKPVCVAGPLAASMRPQKTMYAIGLGHRRLAIIDLTPLGRQPMGTEDDRLWIVYNGEVYNAPELRRELIKLGHRFRSDSDTEVVLLAYREWGLGCLPRFNGMFAFAIWDAREGALICARDRFGIKPLYLRAAGDSVYFASEMKALLQEAGCPRRPNDRAVFDFLTLARQDHTDETFFQDIRQVLPGEWIKVRAAGAGRPLQIVRERWWTLRGGVERITAGGAAAKFRTLMEDAVRLQLRADVPVGSCLSGGLDSSTIVCLMSRRLEQAPGTVPGRSMGAAIETVSSCYEDRRYDERPYIHAVRAHTGAVGHEVFPDPRRLWSELPAVLWHQEEPLPGTSMLAQWAVMQQAGSAGLKVLLDGQGADEVLLGYPKFLGARVADLVRAGGLRAGHREWAAWRAMRGAVPPSAWAALARGLLPGPAARYVRACGTGERHWLAPRFAADARRTPEHSTGVTMVQREMLGTIAWDLPALLHYEDRSAMAFSIESRVPFLDHRLVEWLVRLPADLNLRDGLTKLVLRDAMADVLPEQVRTRRDKLGFPTPQDDWLRGPWRSDIETILASDTFRARPYWDAAVARDWFGRFCHGRLNAGAIIWRWINLEQWLRRFCD